MAVKFNLAHIRFFYFMSLIGPPNILYESNFHNGDATSYPSHHHITWAKKFMTISILHGTCIVIQTHSFVTFHGIDYDKKWASQISDDKIIIIKFMMKKYFHHKIPFIT